MKLFMKMVAVAWLVLALLGCYTKASEILIQTDIVIANIWLVGSHLIKE